MAQSVKQLVLGIARGIIVRVDLKITVRGGVLVSDRRHELAAIVRQLVRKQPWIESVRADAYHKGEQHEEQYCFPTCAAH